MYLSRWEEKALEGEYGEALALAMKILVKVGEAFKAEKLIPITHAHISGVSIHSIGVYGLEFLEHLFKLRARVRVYTTVNPMSLAYIKNGKDRELQLRIANIFISMGVDRNSFTCIPYELRTPRRGEHLSWAESSAVIYANSILGAYTNREGGPLALFAAIAGRTPYYGLHVDENRVPKERIFVEIPIDSIVLAGLAGLTIGRNAKNLPYIEIYVKSHSRTQHRLLIKNLLSSIATTSSLGMVILRGISPYKVGNELLQNLEKISIDSKELNIAVDEECMGTLFLGCPHLSLDEVLYLIEDISKIRDFIRRNFDQIFIAVPRYLEQYPILSDLIAKLRIKVGIPVNLCPGVCPVVTKLSIYNIGKVVTIHGKASFYIPKLSGAETCLTKMW